MPARSSASGSPHGTIRRLLPPGVAAFLRRRASEIAGVVSCALGLTVLVALASHHPADPSLNTAGAGAVRNLAGPAGAALSDALLQGFGVAAVLTGIAPLVWAWRLVSHRPLGSPLARAGMLAASLPFAAAGPALFSAEHPLLPAGPGGVVGTLLMGGAQETASSWLGPLGMAFATIFLAGLGLLLAIGSFGLTAGEWRGAGRAVAVGSGAVALGAGEGAGKAGRAVAGFWRRVNIPGRVAESISEWRAQRRAAAA
ncbi:DNA translocase FtsK 4TM domain-containing protein, partial [Elioraea rosea]|uniref:DNA translocase FtsK 4TM domain-containing protein n=1 Tax=Elioraea rosea TaxID=2492390 RepID=UPI00194FACAA